MTTTPSRVRMALACAALALMATGCQRQQAPAPNAQEQTPGVSQLIRPAPPVNIPVQSVMDVIREATLAAERARPALITHPSLTAEERVRIGGEDANKNGIRDDVEALVTGSKRMSDEQKKASLQLFKAHQQGLLADQTKPEDIQKVQEDLIKSWQCVGQKFGFSQDKPGIKQFIEMYERQMNNTPERENRYGALQCDSLKLLLIDRSAQDKLSKTPCE